MSTEINKDVLDAKAQDAMRAIEGLKSFKEKNEAKLDALDVEEMNKRIETAVTAVEESQKAKQAIEAEKAARAELQNGLEAQLKALRESGEASAKRVNKLEAVIQRTSLTGAKDEAAELESKWRGAFNDFARKENANNNLFADHIKRDEEFKALSVGSQPDGGYMVVPVFGAMVTKRVWETSPMRSLATSISISTDSMEYPLDNDEAASGGWVGEKSARTETDTPDITEQRIAVHEQYAKPKVTQKLLDDASFDVEAWLQGKVADKFTRVENTAFFVGAGVKSPKGFLQYGDVSTPGAFENGKLEHVNLGSISAPTYDGLIKLTNILKQPYQAGAGWVMKRTTYGSILMMKDGENRPIFNMDYAKNAGITAGILGKEATLADDMPAIASGAKGIAYGNFKEGYLIVDRTGIRILRDPYTALPYIQFYTTKRVGGDVVNFEAIKLGVFSV